MTPRLFAQSRGHAYLLFQLPAILVRMEVSQAQAEAIRAVQSLDSDTELDPLAAIDKAITALYTLRNEYT